MIDNTGSLDLVAGEAALADTLADEEPAEHLDSHHGVQHCLVNLEGVKTTFIIGGEERYRVMW